MRRIALPLLLIVLACGGRELAAQVPPPAVGPLSEPEEELRAFPDSVPTTPAVLPAVYSRTVRNGRPSRGLGRGIPGSAEMTIPVGKFGLKLNDGTRLIGQPDKRWPVTLKTGFGTSTIPLELVQAVTAQMGGAVSVHLKNGDRISGRLVVASIPYVTKFGRLTVPSSALVSLQRGVPRVAVKRPGRVVRGRRVRPASGVLVPSYADPAPPVALPAAPSIIDSSSVAPFDTRVIRR